MITSKDEGGWEENAKLVLAGIERLETAIGRIEVQQNLANVEQAAMTGKLEALTIELKRHEQAIEHLAKENGELKTFRTQVVVIYAVVQTMTLIVGWWLVHTPK